MTVKKVRLDVLVVERGLVETREQAKRSIMAGLVFSGSNRMDKPGVKVKEDIPLEIKSKEIPYVGRGGLKLEKALKYFDLEIQDRIMMDIGASTGGFTDCALQNGVSLCYAIDVGYNQLAWKLRNDDRVIVMERTNFRHATPELFTHGEPNFTTIDVSFISLKLIFPPLKDILSEGSDVVALIKPQFEAGKDKVEKRGIVRNPKVHEEVLHDTIEAASENQLSLVDLTYSPITGGDGNIEFLAHFKFTPNSSLDTIDYLSLIEKVVKDAHQTL